MQRTVYVQCAVLNKNTVGKQCRNCTGCRQVLFVQAMHCVQTVHAVCWVHTMHCLQAVQAVFCVNAVHYEQ